MPTDTAPINIKIFSEEKQLLYKASTPQPRHEQEKRKEEEVKRSLYIH